MTVINRRSHKRSFTALLSIGFILYHRIVQNLRKFYYHISSLAVIFFCEFHKFIEQCVQVNSECFLNFIGYSRTLQNLKKIRLLGGLIKNGKLFLSTLLQEHSVNI